MSKSIGDSTFFANRRRILTVDPLASDAGRRYIAPLDTDLVGGASGAGDRGEVGRGSGA
jgi:hypothetical protein